MHVRPPSLCELEISLQGVKLIMSLEDEYDTLDEVRATRRQKSPRSPREISGLKQLLSLSASSVRQVQPLLPDEEHLVLRLPPEEQLVSKPGPGSLP